MMFGNPGFWTLLFAGILFLTPDYAEITYREVLFASLSCVLLYPVLKLLNQEELRGRHSLVPGLRVSRVAGISVLISSLWSVFTYFEVHQAARESSLFLLAAGLAVAFYRVEKAREQEISSQDGAAEGANTSYRWQVVTSIVLVTVIIGLGFYMVQFQHRGEPKITETKQGTKIRRTKIGSKVKRFSEQFSSNLEGWQKYLEGDEEEIPEKIETDMRLQLSMLEDKLADIQRRIPDCEAIIVEDLADFDWARMSWHWKRCQLELKALESAK